MFSGRLDQFLTTVTNTLKMIWYIFFTSHLQTESVCFMIGYFAVSPSAFDKRKSGKFVLPVTRSQLNFIDYGNGILQKLKYNASFYIIASAR